MYFLGTILTIFHLKIRRKLRKIIEVCTANKPANIGARQLKKLQKSDFQVKIHYIYFLVVI
jgi:hypothetical protein